MWGSIPAKGLKNCFLFFHFMFKDEAGGKIIIEFVGLRAKLYSFMTDEGMEVKKCKGIKKTVVRDTLTIDHYRNTLHNKVSQMKRMNVIRSRKHNVYTETINKMALSHEDDKRIILEDDVHTHVNNNNNFINKIDWQSDD